MTAVLGEDDRGQMDVFPLWQAGVAMVALVVYMMYEAMGDLSRQELVAAEGQIVSNCDVGPACGMLPLVYIIVGLFAVALVGGVALRARSRWSE